MNKTLINEYCDRQLRSISLTKHREREFLNAVKLMIAEVNTPCKYCEDYGKKYGPFFKIEFFKQVAIDEEFNCDLPARCCPNCGRRLPDAETSSTCTDN